MKKRPAGTTIISGKSTPSRNRAPESSAGEVAIDINVDIGFDFPDPLITLAAQSGASGLNTFFRQSLHGKPCKVDAITGTRAN
jgi:hypothetical protein